jgi:LDH2 family malate/lactate/ureidoglycolate dehydrogenase
MSSLADARPTPSSKDGGGKSVVSGTVTVTIDTLDAFARRIFERVGLRAEDATVLAGHLVAAHLRGFDTHGVGCIPNYAVNFEEGRVAARPEIVIERRAPWAWAVDGGNGMGHVTATRAMEAVLQSVRAFGIGIASVRHSNHIGAACLYPLMAVDEGYIGLAFANASAHVAPWGSRQKLFGTNPVAVAVPAGERPPFVLDMATSAAARRKFRMALELGVPIPKGWALDPEGNPTTDPAEAIAGSAVPAGGPKGSGLGMMVEILAGVLTGASFAGDVGDLFTNQLRPVDSGHFLMAFDPKVFMPAKEFTARMDALIDRLKALDTAPGFNEVRFPGERAARLEVERRRDGVPLPATTAKSLVELGQRLGIPFPA